MVCIFCYGILSRLPRNGSVRDGYAVLQTDEAASGEWQDRADQRTGNSDENRYIASMTVNGKTLTRNYLTHKELMNGAKITMKMSSTPNKQRGVRESDFPYSFSKEVR